jgi:hypothetical protein
MTSGPGPDYIVQMQPWLGEEEKKAVVEYLDSGGWLTEFRRTREFEQALAAYIGARHVSVVMNGTVSLFAALAALGVGVGVARGVSAGSAGSAPASISSRSKKPSSSRSSAMRTPEPGGTQV